MGRKHTHTHTITPKVYVLSKWDVLSTQAIDYRVILIFRKHRTDDLVWNRRK